MHPALQETGGAFEPALGVTFDFGQTIASLDAELLAARLGERAIIAAPARVEAELGAAWATYNDAIRRGQGGHPWKIFMRDLLKRAGLASEALEEAVEFLWSEQPKKNLWRKPLPGMIDLLRDLHRGGIPIAVLSNSEGKLAELVEELGLSPYFAAIADSGALGFEKPSRRIFEWTAERMGLPMNRIVHVGDSWAADVEGAIAAGMSAIWFGGDGTRVLPPRVRSASNAAETRRALQYFGIELEAARRPEKS
jgi:putative hydrolase of the HAD superfamily